VGTLSQALANPVHFMTGLIVIAVFLGGIIVAISKARFVTQEDCNEKCEGSKTLVNKDDCDDKHEALTGTMFVKIDTVQKDVDAIKLDMVKVEKSIGKFTFFMGQVSQYMKDQKNG